MEQAPQGQQEAQKGQEEQAGEEKKPVGEPSSGENNTPEGDQGFVPGNLEALPSDEKAPESPLPEESVAQPPAGEAPPEMGQGDAPAPQSGEAAPGDAPPGLPPQPEVAEEMQPEPKAAMSQDMQWRVEGVRPFLEDDSIAVTRIAILHHPGGRDKAAAVTLLLNKLRRRELEKTLGGIVEVVNFSISDPKPGPRGIIYYREGHMRAALQVARMIPERQAVLPMLGEMAVNTTVDIEVYLNR